MAAAKALAVFSFKFKRFIGEGGTVMDATPVDVNSIRFPGERGAFTVLLVASVVTLGGFGALLVTKPKESWVILFYVGLFTLGTWLSKVLAMASIRGHGVRVSAKQYPDIWKYVQLFASRLGLKKVPEVYVLQTTLMNAFATKVIGRRYVVLYSHLVDAALESGDFDEVAMILGHEMTHHAAGHVRWYSFLRLAFWVPFLYTYWSRRAEYTCDRGGLLLVNKLQPSLQGIVKLAVGRKLAASTNLAALREQKEQVSRELGPKLVEIFSTHPMTIKRLIAMEDFAQIGRVN
jgi:Zn-dependent protease with chaperone function